jgi:transcriptional regulator with XRE-family HTH domain
MGTLPRPLLVVMAPEDEQRQRTRRGYWLRVARRRAGLTLKQVAVAMDYSLRSQTTIKKWEDGERDPSDIQLAKLAAVYGAPVELFYKPAVTDEERFDQWVREALAAANRRSRTSQTG